VHETTESPPPAQPFETSSRRRRCPLGSLPWAEASASGVKPTPPADTFKYPRTPAGAISARFLGPGVIEAPAAISTLCSQQSDLKTAGY